MKLDGYNGIVSSIARIVKKAARNSLDTPRLPGTLGVFMEPSSLNERDQLIQAIAAQEQLRGSLPDDVLDTAIQALQQRLAELERASGGETRRKVATILFADISGFTALSEDQDAEDIQSLVNALWTGVDAAIRSHHGYIDKHIGDAVMALWGVAQVREDDPEQAIRAALAVQAAVAAFGQERGLDLSVRIGVNTGPVVLGQVGTTGEFTAMGDTVNVAARLEQAAPPGGILISRAAAQQVRGVFELEAAPPQVLKGKAEPLEVFRVWGLQARGFRTGNRGIEGMPTEMIGRARELARLQELLRESFGQSAPRLVTVMGEAGLGKSRLLYEFEQWVLAAGEYSPVVLRGRADLQRQGLSFGLVRELIQTWFLVQDSDSPTQILPKLEAGVAAILGRPDLETAHLLAYVLGLDMADSAQIGGSLADPRQVRTRAFQLLARLISATAPRSPLLLLLDDIHWADGPSLDFIEYLGEQGEALPLLVLANTRPSLYEQRANWGASWVVHEQLALAPLSDAEARELIAHILRKAAELPDELVESIAANAEGNPFYVEELINMLIDEGVIRPEETQWVVAAGELARLKIPPTLTGILQARLDRLQPQELQHLQRAAVIGRTFWDQAVAYLAGLDEPNGDPEQFEPLLATLQARELIYLRPESAFERTCEFAIKHAILHEVTYETVLKKQRAGYHRRAADWLAGQPQADTYASLIAQHYLRAGAQLEMAAWFVRAGKQAMTHYAYDEAIGYFQQALNSQALTATESIDVYMTMGLIEQRRARAESAKGYYQALADLAQQAGDRVGQARAYVAMSGLALFRGDYRTALEEIERGEAMLRALPDAPPFYLAGLLDDKGWVFIWLGEPEAALAAAEESLALATQAAAQQHINRVHNLFGAVYYIQGRYARAAEYWEKALEMNRAAGNRQSESELLNNLGESCFQQGDFAKAREYYEIAVANFTEMELRHYELAGRVNIGAIFMHLGQQQAAVDELLSVIGHAPAEWNMLPYAHRCLAEAQLELGQLEEARLSARRAWELSRQRAVPDDVGQAWRVLGRVLARQDETIALEAENLPHSASDCFNAALAIFKDAELVVEQAHTLCGWGKHLQTAGEVEAATEKLGRAKELFIEKELPLWAAHYGL